MNALVIFQARNVATITTASTLETLHAAHKARRARFAARAVVDTLVPPVIKREPVAMEEDVRPKLDATSSAQRKLAVKRDVEAGMSLSALSRKYDLSRRQLRAYRDESYLPIDHPCNAHIRAARAAHFQKLKARRLAAKEGGANA